MENSEGDNGGWWGNFRAVVFRRWSSTLGGEGPASGLAETRQKQEKKAGRGCLVLLATSVGVVVGTGVGVDGRQQGQRWPTEQTGEDSPSLYSINQSKSDLKCTRIEQHNETDLTLKLQQ